MSKDLWLAGMVFVFMTTVVVCTYRYNMKKLDSPNSPNSLRTITLPPVSNYESTVGTVEVEKPVKKARMWQ